MKKLVATKSSRQIPPIWTTEPNVQDSGITLAANIWVPAFCEFSDMDALTCTTNGRILVVDDNAQALRAMSELLQFEGFSVLTAKNGLDALNKMKGCRSHFPGSARSLDVSDGRVGGFAPKEKRR